MPADDLSAEEVDIICKMNGIVDECIELLKSKRKGYKERLSCLLRALHNMPRVFLGRCEHTVFNIGVKPIEPSDAVAYASSYIDLDLL